MASICSHCDLFAIGERAHLCGTVLPRVLFSNLRICEVLESCFTTIRSLPDIVSIVGVEQGVWTRGPGTGVAGGRGGWAGGCNISYLKYPRA